eukprot:5190578-Pleurochrysis_carterae.AAC.1
MHRNCTCYRHCNHLCTGLALSQRVLGGVAASHVCSACVICPRDLFASLFSSLVVFTVVSIIASQGRRQLIKVLLPVGDELVRVRSLQMSFGAGKFFAVAVILANEQAAVLVLTKDFYKAKAVIDECVALVSNKCVFKVCVRVFTGHA